MLSLGGTPGGWLGRSQGALPSQSIFLATKFGQRYLSPFPLLSCQSTLAPRRRRWVEEEDEKDDIL